VRQARHADECETLMLPIAVDASSADMNGYLIAEAEQETDLA